MKNPSPRIKVFIDPNVLIAGVASVTGASAAVLDLCKDIFEELSSGTIPCVRHVGGLVVG